MKTKVEQLTGDSEPFFCPADFEEGQPYRGHAHVFPIPGAEAITEEVNLDEIQ